MTDEEPTKDELKALHKLIGKEQEDIEAFSYNTTISAFMIALNDLGNCSKRAILEPLTILLCPFAPHIAEELWHQLGHEDSVVYAAFPEYKEELAADNTVKYPVSFNGKTRFFLDAPATASPAEPKWRPGRFHGKKVKTAMTIAVDFKLDKKKGSFGINGIKIK